MRNKLIALWTHPRSISTALCMLIKQRKDLKVLIEPFKFMFYKEFYMKDPDIVKEYKNRKVFTTYEENMENLYNLVKGENIFFKDMAYFVDRKITIDELKSFINVFLIRNPEKTIPSLYYASMSYGIKNISLLEYGYESIHNIYEQCKKFSDPLVIQSEELESNTIKTIRNFEKYVGLEKCDTFSWDESDNPLFHNESSKLWHKNTSKTNKIVPLNSTYKENVYNHKKLKDVWNYCLPYYENIIKK